MLENNASSDFDRASSPTISPVVPPAIALPTGGGAIRGMGEKFAANPVTGTGSISIPIITSPGRSGFGPQLALSYDSGAGNGPFGFGWNLSLPNITRKTDKGLPRYDDEIESDVFILSGSEDLTPALVENGGVWERERLPTRVVAGVEYRIDRYRPRIEGLFARIERWTNIRKAEDVHWRSISRDNILTLYGRDKRSRICDPADPSRIFSWLVCETRDDRGNAVIYEYEPEDAKGADLMQAHEANRGDSNDDRRKVNRYIKRIFYGNRQSLLVGGRRPALLEQAQLDAAGWMFEVVFDYDEGHVFSEPLDGNPDALVDADIAATRDWKPRPDPFSTYRAGFEVRTYRLCQRVLMFHRFPEVDGMGAATLVRSTDLTYEYEEKPKDAANPVYSFLVSATQCGYVRQGAKYLRRCLPPVEFGYSPVEVRAEVEEIDAGSVENLPVGLDGKSYEWIDLHGEGIPGILTEQGGAWRYKRNISPLGLGKPGEVRFAPVEVVTAKPNASLGSARFMDLAGDGQPDLVLLDGPQAGLYEHNGETGWNEFRPFTARLNRSLSDPNARLVDLDGDGHVDVLLTEDEALVWHPSLAEDGFGPAERLPQYADEEKGPHLLFADGTQSVYLADMSGDGLSDLARVRNGEVCYWPNLGYGRFGPKVRMDNAPLFDAPDHFSQARVRLADVDGSGTTDIIYLHPDGARLYFNQSGNSWGSGFELPVFPQVDNVADIQATDLLGDGTACLVWSSPLPGNTRRPLRYVNLMGSQKPHLLVSVRNNLGAKTTVEYAPSTTFYLRDKYEGKPWVTRLPFPVHVVAKVTLTDAWRQTRFSTSYTYHHGYFDGTEREFRGFGRVEQVDVEDYGTFSAQNNSPYITSDKTLYQPPVKTVTWYHTGAFLDSELVFAQRKKEYFPRWLEAARPDVAWLGDFQENDLPEQDLAAAGPKGDEWREALRACKGIIVRQEVYELDPEHARAGDEKIVRIFSAADHSCHIQRLQPQAGNRHAVFLVTENEAITYHYELDLRPAQLAPDPRIVHTLNLRSDEYGNVEQSVKAVYPRLGAADDSSLKPDALALIRQAQARVHLSYSETRYTNDVSAEADDYRLRAPCEVRTYDLTGPFVGVTTPEGNGGLPPANLADRYYTPDELRAYRLSDLYAGGSKNVENIPYHVLPNGTTPQRRLVEHSRSLFFRPSLDAPEPLGALNFLGLAYEHYALALTSGLLDTVFGAKLEGEAQVRLAAKNVGGYLSGNDLTQRLGNDTTGQYWICSGIAGFSPGAAQRFFLPDQYTDAFGNRTAIRYDARSFFVESVDDAAGNRTEVTAFDFRVLAPRQIKDPNDNLAEMAFDALGMPVAMALLGKGNEADSLSGFDTATLNLSIPARSDFFVKNDYTLAAAQALLRSATVRYVYYLGEAIQDGKLIWGLHPSCAAALAREQHASAGLNSPIQAAFEYSDGLGNVLVKKTQAEPETPGAALRWVASGKTIVNNKGKPVKQFEPYFSKPAVGHRYNGEEAEREEGVTPVMYYDAAGRLVRTDAPDGSYSRVEFSPWQVTTHDANDTVNEPGNAWLLKKSAGGASAEDRRAARLSAEHAGTPTVKLLDTLGREIITVAFNRGGTPQAPVDERYVTFTKLDAEGKPLWVQDARGNRVMQYVIPPLPEGPHPFDDGQNLTPHDFTPCYDIAGNLLFQHSMDAGDRWLLNDGSGQPMFAWNSRNFFTRVEYDKLHRPTGTFVTATGDTTLTGAPRNPALQPAPAQQIQKLIYGEEQQDDKKRNLRGKLYQHFDTAGVATVELYDFKGNVRTNLRQLAADYQEPPDWSQAAAPAGESFITSTEYDALSRPIRVTMPDQSIVRHGFNEGNLLDKVDVNLAGEFENGQPKWTPFIRNIDYNAKGQRKLIAYGNGTLTAYDYDEQTFRLTRLKTTRSSQPDTTASALFASPTVAQDLSYTYDAAGNVTRIADASQKTIFCDNQPVAAAFDYRYDALYRLTAAAGRERGSAPQYDWDDADHALLMPPNDANALGCYVETYRYDAVGNIMETAHHSGPNADSPGTVAWRRRYQYGSANNRLRSTSIANEPALPDYADDPAPRYSQRYTHDAQGNMTVMPHLQTLRWDYDDRLAGADLQGGGQAYYVYDAAGQRVRKVIERNGGAAEERVYLGGFEIYRRRQGATVQLERKTLHVMDGQQRIALVETKTVEDGNAVNPPSRTQRYQLSNHLGSASLELDELGRVISYEEYTPYGGTAYRAGRNAAEMSLKRYRYTGKERDEETGFTYHGARYYAPWLGRWTSCDRVVATGVSNRYSYAFGNPLRLTDPDGNWPSLQDLAKVRNRVENTVASIESSAKKAVQGVIDHPLDAAAGMMAGNLELAKETVTKAISTITGPVPSPTTVAQLATSEGRAAFKKEALGSLTPPPLAAYKAYKKSREVDKNDVDIALAEGFMAAAEKAPFFVQAGEALYKADKAFQAGNVREGTKQVTIAGGKYARDVAEVTMMFEGAAGGSAAGRGGSGGGGSGGASVPTGGGTGGAGVHPLAARAQEIHAQLGAHKGIAVSVGEANVPGVGPVRMINVNNPKAFQRLLQGEVQLAENEFLGLGPEKRFTRLRTLWDYKTGYLHAEELTIRSFRKIGVSGGEIGTSLPGCHRCQNIISGFNSVFGDSWRHVNPSEQTITRPEPGWRSGF